jgi:hypothetical protein
VSERVSAFTAAQIPCATPRFRIGAIVKYWKTIPKAKAKRKSRTQTANIFSPKIVCQPSQTAMTGMKNASHSAQMSPRVQPLPQWEAPVATIAEKGLSSEASSGASLAFMRPKRK